jgi:predicted acylesterase/phospholipase RssA
MPMCADSILHSRLHEGSRAAAEPSKPCATEFASVALVLQGGGALGAYQAGVYEPGIFEPRLPPPT